MAGADALGREFGERLAKARSKAGLTFDQVGAAVGRSASTIHSWENGQTFPRVVDLPALADVLKVSIDELFRDRGAPLPSELVRSLAGAIIVDAAKVRQIETATSRDDVEHLVDRNPPRVPVAWIVPEDPQVVDTKTVIDIIQRTSEILARFLPKDVEPMRFSKKHRGKHND